MDFNKIMSKFVLSKSDQNEKEALEDWKAESAENLRSLKDAMQINDISNELKGYQAVDTNAAWEKVAAKSNIDITTTPTFNLGKWMKVAAVALVLIAALAYFNIDQSHNTSPMVYQTDLQKSEIILKDGSKVNLDRQSTVTVDGDRAIKLNGRAYFDIAPDQSHPFTVQISHGLLTVVGTEFDILTDSSYSRIYVSEGTVIHTYQNQKYELHVGDMLTISKSGVVKTTQKDDQVFAWKTGILKFDNEGLVNVLNAVGQYYNLEIKWPKPMPIDNCKINTTFSNESIEQVLKEIQLLSGLDYILDQKKITISSFKCE